MNREKGLCLMVILLFMMLPLISSEELVYKQYQQADLKVPCISNGTYCSSTTICNITVTYPNGSILIDDNSMTNQGNFHNYTFRGNQLTVIGNYPCNMICYSNTENGYSTFSFAVTASGIEEEQERTRTIWLYAFAGILFALLIFIAWKTEMGWIGFLAGMILILPGIHLMIYGFGMYDDLLIRGIATIIICIGAVTIVMFSLAALHHDEEGGSNSDSGSGEEDYDYFKS